MSPESRAVAEPGVQPAGHGHTVFDASRRYRVSPDKIRRWIARGELAAVNTADLLCGRPRWVISAEALAEFEQRRSSKPATRPPRRRRRPTEVDYFPE